MAFGNDALALQYWDWFAVMSCKTVVDVAMRLPNVSDAEKTNPAIGIGFGESTNPVAVTVLPE